MGEQLQPHTESVLDMPLERIELLGLNTQNINTLRTLRQEVLRRSAQRIDDDTSKEAIDPDILRVYTTLNELLDATEQENKLLASLEKTA